MKGQDFYLFCAKRFTDIIDHDFYRLLLPSVVAGIVHSTLLRATLLSTAAFLPASKTLATGFYLMAESPEAQSPATHLLRNKIIIKPAGATGVFLSDYGKELIADGIAELLDDDFVAEVS